jgi:hypothetical protein
MELNKIKEKKTFMKKKKQRQEQKTQKKMKITNLPWKQCC